jgi:hypothetical protein
MAVFHYASKTFTAAGTLHIDAVQIHSVTETLAGLGGVTCDTFIIMAPANDGGVRPGNVIRIKFRDSAMARDPELEALKAKLAAERASWVPKIASNARPAKEGWHLADISGAKGESLLIYRDPEYRTHVDFANGWKGDDLDLIRALKALPDFAATKRYAAELIGFALTERGPIIATYDYLDEAGDLKFQVVKYDSKPKKTFSQRRPDGSGGWIKSVKGVPKVPYRLLELLESNPDGIVVIPEGEKDVDNVRTKLGFASTCNAMGAGKWQPEISHWLKDRDVVIVVGHDHDIAVL